MCVVGWGYIETRCAALHTSTIDYWLHAVANIGLILSFSYLAKIALKSVKEL